MVVIHRALLFFVREHYEYLGLNSRTTATTKTQRYLLIGELPACSKPSSIR